MTTGPGFNTFPGTTDDARAPAPGPAAAPADADEWDEPPPGADRLAPAPKDEAAAGEEEETPFDRQSESIAAARVGKRMDQRRERAEDRIESDVDTYIAGTRTGFLAIEREGQTGMPAQEQGWLEDAPILSVRGRGGMEKYISERHGGGNYSVRARRADRAFIHGCEFHVVVQGDPLVKTAAGRAWLKRAKEDGDQQGNGGIVQLIIEMQERSNQQIREMMAQLHSATASRQAASAEQVEAESKARVEEIRQRARLDEARIRAQADAEKQRAEQERLERLEQQRNENALLMKRIEKEMQADRDAALERRLREKREWEQRMQADADERKAARMREREERRAERRADEMRATNGLGFRAQSKLLSEQAKAIADMTIKQLKTAAGIEDEPEEGEGGIMGALGDAIRQVLPAIIPTLAGAGPQQQPRAPQALAAPPRGMVGVDASSSLPPPPAAQPGPGTPGVVPETTAPDAPDAAGAARAAAAMDARGRVVFVRGLTILLRSRPDPDAAWNVEIADGRDLQSLYDEMGEAARAQARENPIGFISAVATRDKVTGEGWASVSGDKDAINWLNDLWHYAPWNRDQGDDDEGDDDGPEEGGDSVGNGGAEVIDA